MNEELNDFEVCEIIFFDPRTNKLKRVIGTLEIWQLASDQNFIMFQEEYLPYICKSDIKKISIYRKDSKPLDLKGLGFYISSEIESEAKIS